MNKLIRLAVSICYLLTFVTAIPVYRGETTPIDDIYDICNSVAMNRLIFDSSDNLSDYVLKTRDSEDLHEIYSALPANEVNTFLEAFGKSLPSSDKLGKAKDVLETFNDMRKACLLDYLSRESGEVMKKDAEQYEDIDTENFTEMRRKVLRNTENRFLKESVKRDSTLAINPTGWKRRRRDSMNSRDSEDMSKFLRNMRELLEKRDRLSFNPTGW